MKMPTMDADQAVELLERAPVQAEALAPPVITSTSAVRRFISDMPMEVQQSFSSDQLREMSKALTRRYYQGPFVNYHKSLFGYFLTVYAGREKRSQRRLKIDKLKHKAVSVGNLMFLGVCALSAVSVAHLIYTLAG